MNKVGGAQIRSKESEKQEVSKSRITKGTVGHTKEFRLRLRALGTSETMLVWVLHLFFNRCQHRIKHARILLGEMTT